MVTEKDLYEMIGKLTIELEKERIRVSKLESIVSSKGNQDPLFRTDNLPHKEGDYPDSEDAWLDRLIDG
jgi:hypothetical protein